MRRVGEALAERGFSVELVAADAVVEASCGQHVRHVRARDGSGSPGGDGEGGRDRRQLAGRHSQHLPPPHGRTVRAPSRVGARQLGRRHRREQAAAGRLRLGQALRFPRDATRRRHVCRVRNRMARGAAPLRRARHSVRHRAGACGGRSGQILRRAEWRADERAPIGSNGSIIATRECWVMPSTRLV